MRFLKMLAAVLILMFSAGPAAALEPNTSISKCQALETWVSQLDELPADYESFTALDPGQRRAVFNRLSDAERSALWQHQLQAAMVADGFSSGQRALIAEAAGLLTPESYQASRARSGADFPALQDSRKRLEERVGKAFSRQEARKFFYQLGPSAAAAAPLVCDCSLESAGAADCAEGRFCRGPVCTEGFGCGFGGTEWCDGFCRIF